MSDAVIKQFQKERGLLKHRPFHVHIATIFVLLILTILLGLGFITRHETRRMILQSAEQVFEHVGGEITQEIRLLRGPIELAVQFAASAPSVTRAASFEQRMARLGVLTNALELEPEMDAIYFG